MASLLYSLFVWPVRALVEFLFLFAMRWFEGDAGVSVVFLSLMVNLFILPIYNVADRWQEEARALQKKMKPKLADIKAVFKGDERQMIVNAYYRQMGYSPLSSLKSSFGLLLQIPFFLAAYHFLSHNAALEGASFLAFSDLGKPDGLIGIGDLRVNLLPFLMTAVNLASAALYTRGLGRKDAIQLGAMALLFLVLLYDSPAGLVLYWTLNNVFSLAKNAVKKTRDPGIVFYGLALAGIGLFAAATAFGCFPGGTGRLALVAAAAAAVAAARPAAIALRSAASCWAPIDAEDRSTFWASCAGLAVLAGAMIPALLLASSPGEFASLGKMAGRTVVQAAALFLLIPGLAWVLVPKGARKALGPVAAFAFVAALLNAFAFGTVGALNADFTFTNQDYLFAPGRIWRSAAAAFAAAAAVGAAYALGRRAVLSKAVRLAAATLVLASAVAAAPLARAFSTASPRAAAAVPADDLSGPPAPVFELSRSGRNVFLLFLDRAIGTAFPVALENVPELRDELDGFTWYPNTASFGPYTLLTVPSMLGGYEYSPEAMNARAGDWKQKYDESLKVLPTIFSQSGYDVTVTDPAYAGLSLDPDLSAFRGMEGARFMKLKGFYKDRYLREAGISREGTSDADRFDYDILLRFSLFRMAPPLVRPQVYRNGGWWKASKLNKSFDEAMKSYAALRYLPDITRIREDGNTFSVFMNETPHDAGAFGPDFRPDPFPFSIPEVDVVRYGTAEAAEYAYCLTASMAEVRRWLRFLKDNGAYDSSRIVIVADHGGNFPGSSFSRGGLERFNPLLLAKDFGEKGALREDPAFMTNADVPTLLTRGLADARNPFSGKPLGRPEAAGPLLVHDGLPAPHQHSPEGYVFSGTWELSPADVLDPASWTQIKP